MVFSPDSQVLASASDDETVRLWQRETGQEIEQIKGYYGNDISFSKDGSQLESNMGLIPSAFWSNIHHSPIPILSVKNEWVVYKGFEVLRLPPLLFVYAIRDNSLVLGDGYGGMTFLRFSKTLAPF